MTARSIAQVERSAPGISPRFLIDPIFGRPGACRSGEMGIKNGRVTLRADILGKGEAELLSFSAPVGISDGSGMPHQR